MEILFLISFILIIFYIGKISTILTSWTNVFEWKVNSNSNPKYSISVLVPFRNEEKSIKACIASIIDSLEDSCNNQIEIICINDSSIDSSIEQVSQLKHPRLKVISNKGVGKKDALNTGIIASSSELIICTDADCLVGLNWIDTMSQFLHDSNSKMVTGPVSIANPDNFISKWQYLDIIGMMSVTNYGITKNSFHLANGANMAFKKNAFLEINGFDGNEKYASGDDVFLIQKINRIWPGQTKFVKSKKAIVLTKAESSWTALIDQRKRWASKTKGYDEKGVIQLQGFIWLYSLSTLILFASSFITSGLVFFIGLLLLFVKMIMDYLLLSHLAQYFGNRKSLKWYIPISLVHFFYILWAGIHALLPTTYKWKGRSVK